MGLNEETLAKPVDAVSSPRQKKEIPLCSLTRRGLRVYRRGGFANASEQKNERRLLLCFVKFGSKWELSFSRLAGVVRCCR